MRETIFYIQFCCGTPTSVVLMNIFIKGLFATKNTNVSYNYNINLIQQIFSEITIIS